MHRALLLQGILIGLGAAVPIGPVNVEIARRTLRGGFLAGLFLGATQFELTVLERDEINLDTQIVHHIRHKTSIDGKFWIPLELVGMLRTAWSKVDSLLAFTSRDGKPLVHFENGKVDAVRLGWRRLRIAAGLPDALPCKYLRKLAADYALKAGGEAMGQIALSHSRNTVMAKCYTSARDFEKFHEIQQQMHRDLTAAGFFKPFTAEELAAEAKAKQSSLPVSKAA